MIVLRTSTETRTRSTKHGTERYTVTTTHYTVDVNCPCQTARNAFLRRPFVSSPFRLPHDLLLLSMLFSAQGLSLIRYQLLSDSWAVCWVLQMSSRAAPARAPTPAWAPPASARRTPLRCAFGTTSLMTTGRSTTSAAASGNTETTFHNSQFSAGGSRTPDSQVGNSMPAALEPPRHFCMC